MHHLLEGLSESESYKAVSKAITQKRTPVFASGLCESHKAFLLMSFIEKLSKRAVLIVPDEERAEFYKEFFRVYLNEEDILLFPSREYIFRNIESISHADEGRRIKALLGISRNDYKLLIITADALLQPVIPQDYLLSLSDEISTGQEYPMQKLIERLSDAGYERCEMTDGQGQFSVRGGIVEFYPLDAENPVRIEFFGDEVELMGEYSPITQRRIRNIEKARITPALEVLPGKNGRGRIISFIESQIKKLVSKPEYEKTCEMLRADLERLKNSGRFPAIDKYLPLCFEKESNILEYINGSILFSFEMQKVKETMNGFSFRVHEELKGLIEDGIPLVSGDYLFSQKKLYSMFETHGIVMLETFARSENDIPVNSLATFSGRATALMSDIRYLAEDLRACLDKGYGTVVLAGSVHDAEALAGDLNKENLPAVLLDDDAVIPKGVAAIIPASLPSGFEDDGAKLAVFSNGKAPALTRLKKTGPKKHKPGDKIHGFSDIRPGDYVVHINYGIGVYEGIHKIEVEGIIKDFLKIRYAGSDTLYIPCSQLDLISKYVGTQSELKIKLNKLGTGDWQKTRQRVKHAVKDLAKDLIALYSERMKLKGYAFAPDTDWQREFEDKFEFEETDDQLRCTEEIKADMESLIPMDRLLCGDVGFGKTEVALRAVFKCVMEGKQAAIMVPTTLLAWQHFNTINKRMAGFPVKTELLSRFRTPKQQEEILKLLRKGQIDIVVGTHRLIQKDIGFKSLGLVIVDEEQRFGVAHKERLKELTKQVDVLTLSATPIPRTLNMALAGIRDMSVIEEPPHDRHPVNTYVCEYDEGIIIDALKREVQRGGQCYYLYNRVETIYRTANRLAEQLPGVNIDVAHGQMDEEDLALVWERLLNREIDILVCTTIIETGVDVPNANTLIIEDADRLGLAQLHQIRGRVGRSARRAYAYFTYRRGKVLTEEATKRLSAIREFTEFGSGLKIAMRDLEIRGAGNILGAQQHGHMESVGYDMYLRLLEEAVREERGEAPLPEQCTVELSVSAYIPETFIASSTLRIDMYKKISSVENEEDISDCIDEIIDRFGEPPSEMLNLIDIAYIRSMASKAGFYELTQKGSYVLLFINNPDLKALSGLMADYKGQLLFSAGQKPYLSLKIPKPDNVTRDLKIFLDKFSKSKVVN